MIDNLSEGYAKKIWSGKWIMPHTCIPNIIIYWSKSQKNQKLNHMYIDNLLILNILILKLSIIHISNFTCSEKKGQMHTQWKRIIWRACFLPYNPKINSFQFFCLRHLVMRVSSDIKIYASTICIYIWEMELSCN